MNRIIVILGAITALLLAIFALSSFYTVDPTEQVIVFQFGAPQQVVTRTGPAHQGARHADRASISTAGSSISKRLPRK